MKVLVIQGVDEIGHRYDVIDNRVKKEHCLMEHGLRLLTDFISHQGNKKTGPEDLRLQIWGVFFLFVVFSHT